MSFRRISEDEPQMDQALKQTLKDYRSSVHAWSAAEYSQPHRQVRIYKTSWRVAASWGLGCLLAVGSVCGAVYERRQIKEQERIAATEAARQQKIQAEHRRASEDLFAKIDSDVSREVPSAMEPLAKMMVEGPTE